MKQTSKSTPIWVSLKTVFMVLTVLGVLLSTTCTNSMLATVEEVVSGFQKPRVLVNLESGASLAGTTTIVFTFNKSMDRSSLAVEGSLKEFADAGTWSSGQNANDTLEIAPADLWPVGADRTLALTCADTESFTTDPFELVYGVLDGVIYVHATAGADTNPGTHDRPKKTIQAAVDAVEAVYDEAHVSIAGGTYQSTEGVFIQKRLHLVGGYNPTDWEDHDPAQYESVVQILADSQVDTAEGLGFGGTDAAGASASYLRIRVQQPQSAYGVAVNASNATLNNVDIKSAGREFATAVGVINGAVTITDSLMKSEGFIDTTKAYGIIAIDSEVTILDSLLEADYSRSWSGVSAVDSLLDVDRCRVINGNADVESYGAVVMNSTLRLSNTVIDAGTVSGTKATGSAIIIEGGQVVMWNNTLDGGRAAGSATESMLHGIIFGGSTRHRLENNIILVGSGDKRYGVKQVTSASTPAIFNNNLVFFNGLSAEEEAEYRYVPVKQLFDTAGAIEGFISNAGGDAADNLVGVDPDLNVDYSLGNDSPENVKGGGRNLSNEWPDATDIRGIPRPPEDAWSIGAYEAD